MSAANPEGVTVTGTGAVASPPDVASTSLTVSVVRGRAVDATRDASAVAANMLAVLDAEGVASTDVASTGLSVGPEIRWDQGTAVPLGFRASTTLAVTVRSIDRVGSVLDALVEAGGDDLSVSGISFRISDAEAATSAARDLAFARARSAAQRYAELAGRALGPVMYVREVAGPPTVVGPIVLARAAGPADMPVQAGEQDVEVSVEVRWAFA